METKRAAALFDCIGEDASELSFQKGDKIQDSKTFFL